MYDVIQSATQTGESEDVNTEEDMQNIENAHSLTKMKLQKGMGIIWKRKQQAILHAPEGTKSIQNQKNIITQSFSSITHGIMKMA